MPTFEINGTSIYYRVEGQPFESGAETVALVHGELSRLNAWDATVATLSGKYRVVRYDRMARAGVSVKQYASELEALLEHLGADQYHLVGHSGGGLVALRAAALHPERALTLTMADSLARMDVALEVKVRSVLEALKAGGSRLAFTVAAPWLWGPQHLTGLEDRLGELYAHVSDIDQGSLQVALEYILAFGDQRKWLRAVTCPTLVAVGSDDLLTPLRYSHEVVEWIKQGLGVLVTITHGGHNAPFEKPAEWTRVLGGFLERHKEFVSGPSDWDDDNTEDDGAEFHDLSDLESLR